MNMFSRNRSDDRPGGLRRRLADLPQGVKWGALAALFVVVIFIGWLGLQGLTAKSNLEQARDSAEQAKDALLSGKSDDATRFAENAQFHARQAQTATHSLPWNIAAAVPLIGSPLKTTQQISDVVVGLADDVLLPGATMGAGLSPDKLIDGTRLDLKSLRAEQPRLTELAAAAAKLDSQAQAISSPGYVPLISDARSQLQDQTSRLAQLLGNSSIAAQLAPSMLGADGPRSYLLAFQTPAEARGTGGLLGGFGILRFDNGIPTIDTLGSNVELGGNCEDWRGYDCTVRNPGSTAEVDLGPEFNAVYGWAKPLTDFRNSNLSPHFPYAAQIWKSMWDKRFGVNVDGVIALDPVVLSYVLGAIGPVTLTDGEVINEGNVVELTMSTAYIRFSNDQNARKKYLQDIASAVVKKMTGPVQSPRQLIDALGKAAGERRISVWSASQADQKLLEETPLAHVVPDDEAPYAQLVVNNLAGNKMDYYLERDVEYTADNCDGDMRNSTITVRLTNTATDRPLPDNVAGMSGLLNPDGTGPLTAPPGTMVSSVRVLVTKGARLLGVTSNGKRTTAFTNVENGRPSFEVQVAIPPGQSGELNFRLSEPTSAGEARVPVQPLVDNLKPKVSVPACSS